MNYDNRFNLFLKSNSEIEKNYIVNYKKNYNEKSLLEYCCDHNLCKWLNIIKSYANTDLLEYYSKSEKIEFKIFKLLFIKYKKSYLQNIILYSCDQKAIEYLLYFDNNSYFSFNLLIEMEKIDIIKLFIKYGYKVQNYEIELLVMKNLIIPELFQKIYEWSLFEKKNSFYIFKYCNNLELIEFFKLSGFNFSNFDLYQKDIFMYTCENLNVDINLLIAIIKVSNYIIHREDMFNNNALYYYCLNKNFNQEIYNFLININCKLTDNLIKKLLNITTNPLIFKNLEEYNIELLPYKYDINLLSNHKYTLEYFDQKYGLYNYIDLDTLIFNIIENENYDSLIYILNNYPLELNLEDNYGNTILDLICSNENKNLTIVKYLVESGINIYNKNVFGYNCIFNMLNSDNVDIEILKYLLTFERISYSYNNNLERVFHVICKLNLDFKYLELLKNLNLNYNLLDKNKNTALNYALQNNNIKNVRYFFSFNIIDLYTINNIGLNTLDYLLNSNIYNFKLLQKFKIVTLKNIENYINNKKFNIKVFAYLISKLKNKFKSNKNGDNILLLVCKTYFNNTKIKLKVFDILKNFNYNFNKLNHKNENPLILTMKYDQNYYLIKYLLKIKVSTFIRDNKGNNALFYSKNIKNYNLLQKYSIKRSNFLEQNILQHLFIINYLNKNFIIQLCNHYNIKEIDYLNKNILDYFIENGSTDIEMFDYILNFIEIKNKHINYILKSRNRNLCLYLLVKNKLDINYLDYHKFGILDYFSFDSEIVNLVCNNYNNKIRNKQIVISDIRLLNYIDNIDNYIFNIENNKILCKVIKDYKLKQQTIIKLLDNKIVFETILNSKNCIENLIHNNDNILILLLKRKYSLEKIKILLENKSIDINYLNSEKKNALYYSLYDLNILKYLIELKCNINILDINLESILYYAVSTNQKINIIEYLIKTCKLNVNLINHQNLSMIFKTKSINIIKILLENGLDKNHKDNSGNTYLNYYVTNKNIDVSILDLLIVNKYNFNTLNNNHCTPLINFIKNNVSIYILSIILKYQNTINLQDLQGNTALITSLKIEPNQQIVHLLLKYGADVNILDNYNRNCLFYCNSDNYLPIIIKLISYNINYNLIIEDRTYLILYTWWGMEQTVKYLIDNFKDININYLDQMENNVLFYAAGIYSEHGNLDLIKYFHQKGVNIKQINKDKYNLLFVAAGVSGYNIYDNDIIKYLINHLDISHQDKENNTFIVYLKEEYLENLIQEKILDNKQSEVMEIIYSKNIKKLMPFEIEFENRNMKEKTCGICLQNFESDEIINECNNNHTFHRECLIKWYQESQKIKCPYCTLKFSLNHKAIKCL